MNVNRIESIADARKSLTRDQIVERNRKAARNRMASVALIQERLEKANKILVGLGIDTV